MQLQDKTIVVTGASRGIGKTIVQLCAQRGAHVIACVRTESAARVVEGMHENIHAVIFDLTDYGAMKKAVLEIRRRFQAVDGLVNNAGVMSNERLGFITEDEIHRVLETNVVAPLLLTQYLVRLMSSGASIVNLSSIVAERGNAGQIAYSSSKGAVISMTKSLAKELAPRGIRVNAIAPGLVETDAIDEVAGDKLQVRIDGIGMGRLGQPSDIAQCCSFLLSDDSAYISGDIIGVNGCSIL